MDSDFYAEEFRLLNLPENQTKQMQIQIVTTSIETKPTAKGSYQQLEVVFKNLTFQGKVESKKLMSFGAAASTFKVLSQAQAGNVFEVTTVKNDKGYIDWTDAKQTTGEAAPSAASNGSASKATPAPKSNYETPEERAQRQILIVRQSSIGSAVALLTAGAKSAPKTADVIATAKELEAYVFGVEAVEAGPTGFDDLPDFEADIS